MDDNTILETNLVIENNVIDVEKMSAAILPETPETAETQAVTTQTIETDTPAAA